MPPATMIASAALSDVLKEVEGSSREVRLYVLRVLRDTIDHEIETQVYAMRDAGDSWGVIGAALGVTRQSVWQRYSETDEPGREVVEELGHQLSEMLDERDL